MRLINDVDTAQVRRIFEILREETNLFEGLASDDVLSLQTVFKFLTFKRYHLK